MKEFNGKIVFEELNNVAVRKTDDGRYSVFDVIKVCCGKKGQHKVWNRLIKRFSEYCDKVSEYSFGGKGGAAKKTPVATTQICLEIIGLLPGQTGQAYRQSSAELMIRYLEGDAQLGAELMLRDHNKANFDKAKRRIGVTETNKGVADLVNLAGANHGQIHNLRYQGIYRQNAQSMRDDLGISKKETPLNYMSEYDLSLNHVANQMALKAGDPFAIYGAGNSLRKAHKEIVGDDLKPTWEESCLPPKKARRILKQKQLELSLGGN